MYFHCVCVMIIGAVLGAGVQAAGSHCAAVLMLVIPLHLHTSVETSI